jgi:hypothetical protein
MKPAPLPERVEQAKASFQTLARLLQEPALPRLRSRFSDRIPHTDLASWKELMAAALVLTPAPAWAQAQVRARTQWQ